MIPPGDPALARRLAGAVRGDVLTDPYSRGRYATDASFYQVEPAAVVIPRDAADVAAVLEIATEVGLPVTPRGAGTSQCGQAIGSGIVVDTSRWLTAVGEPDPPSPDGAAAVTVGPGVVLDHLNARLRPLGLWFPVDVATASRATLGGMAGNNSAGARSLRYGTTVDHVLGVEALLADGTPVTFGSMERDGDATGGRADRARAPGHDRLTALAGTIAAVHAEVADELRLRVPDVPRHVAGYNLHRLGLATGVAPDAPLPDAPDLTPLLVGSEGTLAFFTKLRLALSPFPAHRALGVCAFASLGAALDAVAVIVELRPTAVELTDGPLLRRARELPAFRDAVRRVMPDGAGAVLLVEFAGDEAGPLGRDLDRLEDVARAAGATAVLRATDPARQREIWNVRKAALNIVTSERGAEKPVSGIEDCAIPVGRLREWGERLNGVFERHGTRGTWYGHASVGCLHVRPYVDLHREEDAARLRAITEEAHAIVRDLGGSHSGEHGDGILRSEFIEPMLGPALAGAFRDVKRAFDPDGRLNPGRIVDAPRMDDRALFRYRPGYAALPVATALDWSGHGGLLAAAEMCNNNGACRKRDPGVMCPPYRVTEDERDVTRGRANTLRLALTGQLGDDALASDGLKATMDLCVGCKACRTECPAGVDVARMKIEFRHAYNRRHGVRVRDRLVAYLPRWAPYATRVAMLLNMRNRVGGMRRIGERMLGIAAARPLPRWSADPFDDGEIGGGAANGPGGATVGTGDATVGTGDATVGTGDATVGIGDATIGTGDATVRTGDATVGTGDATVGIGGAAARPTAALFVDTFARWFEPEIPRAALRVLEAAGHHVVAATPAEADGRRPLCCGRTFLNAGMVDQAREEAARSLRALAPFVRDGARVVGLEPSCLLTFRDEVPVLFPPDHPLRRDAEVVAEAAVLVEELLAAEAPADAHDPGAVDSPPDEGGGTAASAGATRSASGRIPLGPLDARTVIHVHGHCHQKAFGAAEAVARALGRIPGADVRTIESGCCGMAGSFGYEAEHHAVSLAMGELALLPAVRAAGEDDWIVADGTSCRAQIRDGTGRRAVHAVEVLAAALDEAPPGGVAAPGERASLARADAGDP